eukprot:TRINITY_DN4561_c0_g3_i4.p1 TRINITY_DN4561_c0_g3~~TRINITY_DN4561_c0_g3_i4.p1  ORF type:complete len:378 (-),score=-36.40 TRINITY_DN4561_c0_g3_i4:76-1110(-)
MITTFIIVITAIIIFAVKTAKEDISIDLRSLKLDLTSVIYVNDDNGNPQQYQQVYSTETRVWAGYDKIPKAMKDAIVAIEDKRFYSHPGVDFIRTFGATFNYMLGKGSYGGSTITQQLVKNLTNKKEISPTRKLIEIISALDVESKYSKDEILETYLNVVNFGGGTNGVEAAANLYFGKSISECDIAECACIAGITQNPTQFNPLLNPESNKRRQQIVITAMRDQGLITDEDYNTAMNKSNNMTFVGKKNKNNTPINNWYTEAMLNDVTRDLAASLNVDEKMAQHMVMHGGYKIYSAMDTKAQDAAESVIAQNASKVLPSDEKLQVGYMTVSYTHLTLPTKRIV